jgi:ABC-2 type transport system ATP-binding protein
VFVSSHLLAEVQVLADVVGIIARGKLVREGTLDSLLNDQGVVRVRVARAQVAAATAALTPLATVEPRDHDDADDQWLAVHLEPVRAAEVNQRLAEAGVYASGLESGTDLELLFLELTSGSEAASHEGTFGSIGTPGIDAGKGAAA